MRKILSSAIALSLFTPAVVAPVAAEAKRNDYRYKEWRGRDGRMYCRKTDGTIGLVVGAAGGALLGRAIDSEGDRTTGSILGAAAGALLGKEVASRRRCR